MVTVLGRPLSNRVSRCLCGIPAVLGLSHLSLAAATAEDGLPVKAGPCCQGRAARNGKTLALQRLTIRLVLISLTRDGNRGVPCERALKARKRRKNGNPVLPFCISSRFFRARADAWAIIQ